MKLSTTLLLALPLPAAGAQAPLYEHQGQAPNDLFGSALAGLGDVDGDGTDDFAVGAPYASGLQPGAGAVTIVSGRTGLVLASFLGERSLDSLGTAVAGIGDVDGDGAGDLVAGAPRYDSPGKTENGAVYVVSGATGSLLWKHVGAATDDWAGHAVAGPGDIDGDGIGDYAFSLPKSDATFVEGGIVYIYSGATHTPLRVHHADQSYCFFGYSLDAAGDVNKDGVPDLVVGAPYWDWFSTIDAGRGYVFSGAADDDLLFYAYGSGVCAALGWSVAGGFDLDGDGVLDAAFGEPFGGASGGGRVRTVSGTYPFPNIHTLDGSVAGDLFGISLDLIPDADGDGRPDILAGASGANSYAGRATLFNGAFGLLAFDVPGEQAGEQMGASVAGVGHLNADGFADIAVGASHYDVGGSNVGRALTLLGSSLGPKTYCAAKVNSAGCTPYVASTGGLSLSAGDNFHVLGMNVLEGKTGILIWSRQPKSSPFYGGTLCVKAPIKRTPLQSSASVPSALPCPGVYDFHASQAYLASKSVTAGETLHFQYWSRDSGLAPPNSIGLTDALQVAVLP